VVCIAAAIALGLWQLSAWHIHRVDAASDISHDKPVALSTLMTGDSPFPGRSVGRPVTFSGTWLSDSTLYVQDEFVHGKRGYWVVTPVVVDGTKSAIPVVRGWSAKPRSATISGHTTLTGWLEPTDDGGVDTNPDDDIIPTLQIATVVQYVDEDLFSAYLVANGTSAPPASSTGALSRVPDPTTPTVSGFTGLRNLFYAIEWWFFGGFAIFVWARWCRDTYELLINPPQEGPGPDDGPGPDPDPSPASPPASMPVDPLEGQAPASSPAQSPVEVDA
jgi:cytochrome oxidase assembly protein ShyY1